VVLCVQPAEAGQHFIKHEACWRWSWSFSMPYCELCEMGGGKRKIWNRYKIIIIIIIINHHELGLNRHNSLFQGLPSCLRPFCVIQHYFWHPVVVHYCYMSWSI
jgi:hypothetical protein